MTPTCPSTNASIWIMSFIGQYRWLEFVVFNFINQKNTKFNQNSLKLELMGIIIRKLQYESKNMPSQCFFFFGFLFFTCALNENLKSSEFNRKFSFLYALICQCISIDGFLCFGVLHFLILYNLPLNIKVLFNVSFIMHIYLTFNICILQKNII